MNAKRILIHDEPFVDPTKGIAWSGTWPASWVCHPEVGPDKPVVLAYRRAFTLSDPTRFRIHVSADERYELFLDGGRIGRGPEQGDRNNWFFETYEVDLPAGEHLFVARTWWLGPYGPSPHAQITVRPAFLFAAQGVASDLLDTGVAPWECKRLGGYAFVSPAMAWGTGAKLFVKGEEFSWGFEAGAGDGWQGVSNVGWRIPGDIWPAASASLTMSYPGIWLLRPATVPPMFQRAVTTGIVREGDDAAGWNDLLCGRAPVSIPPNATRRVLVDLENYYCAYPEVVLSGGKGATVRMFWAESLFEDVGKNIKGNRNEVHGKQFVGVGDTFESDGGIGRRFGTLWWELGRYIEIVVTTRSEPLTIESLQLLESRYPVEWQGKFTCSDRRMEEIIPICLRTLEVCSHETFTDGPYYEQLQYSDDTRLSVLVNYVMSRDDRLIRKAIRMFDESRLPSGLTRAQYPSRWLQIIPPHTLWWVGMVYDFALWRDDVEFVRDRMGGVRAVLDAFRRWVNADGLLEAPEGWNFIDWVAGWDAGIPPDGGHGVSSVLNWLFVYILRLCAKLENLVGEPELAERNTKLADNISAATISAFWDEGRNLFADDIKKQHFSEHAQCLAVLAGAVDVEKGRAMLQQPGLVRSTIYFTHYLFEAYGQLGLDQLLFDRMGLWFELKQRGFKTTPERPWPDRSDCHSWSTHPVYHQLATILGVRPSSMGFKTVRIAPQPGPLTSASGKVVHPQGFVEADFRIIDGKLTGSVVLPEGITGTLCWEKTETPLRSGRNEI